MSSSIIIVKKATSENQFQLVSYEGKEFYVGYIPNKELLFVFDAEEKDKVIDKIWCINNNYLANSKKFLHRIIMNANEYTGKNPVDHINRIPRDNRKENLRLTSTSENVRNRDKMKRNADLPIDCGILPDDIPKNIWYIKDEGEGKNKHGERWCLEIKGLPKDNDKFKNGKFVWKSTSSRDVSLKVKLEQTIQKLKELREEYPAIKLTTTLENEDNMREDLVKSFNDILNLSSFPKEIKEKNLVNFKSDLSSKNISESEQLEATKVLMVQNSGKKKEYEFPSNFNISQLETPLYVSYKKATLTRGDSFVIENHPNLKKITNKNGNPLRTKSTRSSKLIPTEEKYKEVLSYLHSLDNDLPFEDFEGIHAKRGEVEHMKNPSESFSLEEIPIKPRKYITNLPEDCGILPQEVPEHIGYNKEKSDRGCSFVIKTTHPILKFKGLKPITSSCSRTLSIRDKLDEIKERLKKLELSQNISDTDSVKLVKDI